MLVATCGWSFVCMEKLKASWTVFKLFVNRSFPEPFFTVDLVIFQCIAKLQQQLIWQILGLCRDHWVWAEEWRLISRLWRKKTSNIPTKNLSTLIGNRKPAINFGISINQTKINCGVENVEVTSEQELKLIELTEVGLVQLNYVASVTQLGLLVLSKFLTAGWFGVH